MSTGGAIQGQLVHGNNRANCSSTSAQHHIDVVAAADTHSHPSVTDDHLGLSCLDVDGGLYGGCPRVRRSAVDFAVVRPTRGGLWTPTIIWVYPADIAFYLRRTSTGSGRFRPAIGGQRRRVGHRGISVPTTVPRHLDLPEDERRLHGAGWHAAMMIKAVAEVARRTVVERRLSAVHRQHW